MANKGLFASLKSQLPRADARNEEGAVAYALPIKHALAQLAATGCFNGTFYAQADDQLATLLNLVNQVDDNVFLAKLAVYSRERAFMKDMPAALLLVLSKRDRDLFRKVVRTRRGQWPSAAHAVPDGALGPIWPQELVVRAAARISALAE